MKWCVERADGGCLSLCLYTDEVVPRNKLRPDMGGKYQAVYFQVLDFPDFIRSRLPPTSFTFGSVSCREFAAAGIGVVHLNRLVLHPLAWAALESPRHRGAAAPRHRGRAHVCPLCMLTAR